MAPKEDNIHTVVSFIKNIFSGFVNGIKEGIAWILDKFNSLPPGLQVVLAAMFPIIGIPLLIMSNWDTITEFFGNLWINVKTRFTDGIQSIKDFFSGLPEWFRESGRKIIETFTSGIMSAISAPAKAVKDGLQKVRNLLPFSDAKEGPLSTLTLSGQRMLETVSTGIDLSSELPAERVQESLGKIELSGKKLGKVQLGGDEEDGQPEEKKGKNFIIEKLFLNVSMKELEDLKKLKKLLEEVEDYANSEYEGDGLEPEPA